RGVGDVADHHVVGQCAREYLLHLRAAAREQPQAVPRGSQRADAVGAGEAGAAGDEHAHRRSLPGFASPAPRARAYHPATRRRTRMTLLIWTIGDVKITRIPEVTARLVLAEFFPEATPEAVALHRSWLEPHFLDAEGGILLSIHGLVVDTGELRILVDTCLGPHAIPGFEDLRAGAQDFPGALAAAGYPREAIDIVMCTHLHF